MNWVNRIFIVALVGLVLSLSTGFEVYAVYCNMRGETFVSLQQGMDPCLTEAADSEHGCCAKQTHCPAGKDQVEDEKGGCCDEEEIVISYTPESFYQYTINLPAIGFFSIPQKHFSSEVIVVAKTASLQEHPQPPPLQGRQILTFHCVWRI